MNNQEKIDMFKIQLHKACMDKLNAITQLVILDVSSEEVTKVIKAADILWEAQLAEGG